MVGIQPPYYRTLYHGGYTASLLCLLLYYPGYTHHATPHSATADHAGLLTTVGCSEALGSILRLIRDMRRIEAFLLPEVWRMVGNSAHSALLSPGVKDGKIG